MYGLPQEMGPLGFDPSMFMLSGYLLAMLAGFIAAAVMLGIVTLPIFFLVLYLIEQVAWAVAEATGAFAPKLVLIMFRGAIVGELAGDKVIRERILHAAACGEIEAAA